MPGVTNVSYCECFKNGNSPPILTDRRFSNVCGTCNKPFEPEQRSLNKEEELLKIMRKKLHDAAKVQFDKMWADLCETQAYPAECRVLELDRIALFNAFKEFGFIYNLEDKHLDRKIMVDRGDFYQILGAAKGESEAKDQMKWYEKMEAKYLPSPPTKTEKEPTDER